MKEHGVEIVELTPEEKQRFQDAMKPIWEKYGSKHKEMLDRIQAVK